MVKKNSIPDGWKTVTPIGQPLPGTRFIAFKVPLKGTLNQRLTPAQKFTPKDLINAIKALNVELGLIIDLTYTTRYYEVKDLPKSIHYKKLYTVGLEVPDNATILQFKKWVRKFLWENAKNEKLIGVHCTNGINRTGYLICRYLIDVEGWDPDTAIQVFSEARGHRMDGCVYLKDLKTRPVRSNLGMDVWDSDGGVNELSDSMEDSRDWAPDEASHGSGKKISPLDHHSCSNSQIKDSDYINSGTMQSSGLFHDQQCNNLQGDSQPRNWNFAKKGNSPGCVLFANYQCYNDLPDMMDFCSQEPGTKLRPFHGLWSYNDFQEGLPGHIFDLVNNGNGLSIRSFYDHQVFSEQFPMKNYGFVNRGQEQKQRSFYTPHEYAPLGDFQNQLSLKGFDFLNSYRVPKQRLPHGSYPHSEMHLEGIQYANYEKPVQESTPFHGHQTNSGFQEEGLDFINAGHLGESGQPLSNNKFHQKSKKQMQFQSFDLNNGTGERPYPYRPFYYSQEQMALNHSDFVNRTTGPRQKSFQGHTLPDGLVPEWYLNRTVCPEDNRRINPSDEFTQRGQNRFTPYSSLIPQEGGGVYSFKNANDNHHHETSSPLVIDHNCALPSECRPKDEKRLYPLNKFNLGE